MDAFIDQGRKKFLGYGDLNNDNETLIGLPYPIHESVRILKQVTIGLVLNKFQMEIYNFII